MRRALDKFRQCASRWAQLQGAGTRAHGTAPQWPPPGGPSPSGRTWSDPRRPVQLSQGTLALLLLGGVALGSQGHRLTRAWPDLEASAWLRAWTAHAQQLPPAHGGTVAPPPPLSEALPLSGCLSPYFIADAAAKAAPSVVNISAGAGPGSAVASSGSGFVIDETGTVLTNAHVVLSDGARPRPGDAPRRLSVTLQDGRVFGAALVSYDVISDLAVLRIDAGARLPAARLGSSQGLRVGEWVVALGSPLHLANSVTAGIVSAVDRKALELGLAGARTEQYIQTDAAINRGNSGGPLVNLAGEVVGISCMKAVAADGVSFAIPIDAALEVVAQLAQHGRVIRPYIGIKMLQLNAHSAAALRQRDALFPSVSEGILVPHVQPGSPAARAGLQRGDVIVGVAGRPGVPSTSGLIKALQEHIGEPLELRVVRPGGQAATLNIRADEAPS